MTTVAIIPARGGSKGIPRKNLRRVAGRSLVGWSVLAGLEAELVDEVVVSSDSAEILEEAVRCGAKPLQRPDELATDEASTDDVLMHAMNALGWKHDVVVTLQPTVPIREPWLVDAAIRRLIESGADSVHTCEEGNHHFFWKQVERKRHNGEPVGMVWVQCNARGLRIPRQAFKTNDFQYPEDGAVTATRAKFLATARERLAHRSGIASVLLHARTIDIDTEADLRDAEGMMMARLGVLTAVS